ncbi:MAG: hypothetical protein KJ667_05560, partial [Alphaproteobacteria bacterium]|nr:hypothetical protein [Alphaproteobacteria bacterium]
MIPIWFLCALAASVFSALGNFTHQKLGGTNTASAVWMKIIALTISIPMIVRSGLPTEPMFYVMTAGASAIWCINDLVYFNAVKNHGAALLSRLWPMGTILGFMAWFFIKPDLFTAYMQDMPRFAGIIFAVTLCVGCAIMLQRCAFSAAAFKAVWKVILLGVLGIILVKSAVDYAPSNQSVFGYLGIEAAIMLVFYGIYFKLRRPAAFREVTSLDGAKTGGMVAAFLVSAGVIRMYAFDAVDHPAFVTAVCMLDVVWLMIITRIVGWEDKSNKWAGLGIVVAAIAL